MEANGKKVLPEEIKQLRERRNWSQKQLAEMLNVNDSTVSRWERGQVEPQETAAAVLYGLVHTRDVMRTAALGTAGAVGLGAAAYGLYRALKAAFED
jgi:transcriptional regulator with XRE-family HTH domain